MESELRVASNGKHSRKISLPDLLLIYADTFIVFRVRPAIGKRESKDDVV